MSSAAKAVEPLLSSTLVGSYRRGKNSCGDIDVMITKPDNLISKDILSQLLNYLKDSGNEQNKCPHLHLFSMCIINILLII